MQEKWRENEGKHAIISALKPLVKKLSYVHGCVRLTLFSGQTLGQHSMELIVEAVQPWICASRNA